MTTCAPVCSMFRAPCTDLVVLYERRQPRKAAPPAAADAQQQRVAERLSDDPADRSRWEGGNEKRPVQAPGLVAWRGALYGNSYAGRKRSPLTAGGCAWPRGAAGLQHAAQSESGFEPCARRAAPTPQHPAASLHHAPGLATVTRCTCLHSRDTCSIASRNITSFIGAVLVAL